MLLRRKLNLPPFRQPWGHSNKRDNTMKTIAICNHKGGTAKTTSTYFLGTLLAANGLRTLLVDLDPQANLSKRFYYTTTHTMADALGGAVEPRVALAEILVPADHTGHLTLAPSEMQLANTAVGLLNDAVRGRTALRRALATVKEHFDLCLIDCPPEAGIMLVNALLAADGLLCPAEPEGDALAGVQRITDIAADIRREFERASPVLLGTIATRVDARTIRHRDGLALMQADTDAPVRSIIPESNGEQRDDRLRSAYATAAAYVADWCKGAAC